MSDAGIYICLAENKIGNITKTFNVTINERPQVISNFMNITISNINQKMTVKCEAKGIPEPKINWIFDGPEEVEFDGPILMLNSSNDRGYYKCKASNVVGSAEEKFYANIRLMDPFANITKIKKGIRIRESETMELFCPFKKFEAIKWYYNGKEIKGNNFQVAENRLTVKHVKRNHTGNWGCNVWSMKDKFSFVYKVDVAAIPKAKVEWFKNDTKLNYNEHFDIEESEFSLGDNLKLVCNFTGNPKPVINWLKGNSMLGNGIELKIENLQHKDK